MRNRWVARRQRNTSSLSVSVLHLLSALPVLAFTMLISGSRALGQPAAAHGAYFTRRYPNLFTQLLQVSDALVQKKIDSAFQQLFFGDNEKERIFYPVQPDMGYIIDVANNDVRTEGMSYGMMIAVQMNRRDVFDRIWKWAFTHMLCKQGPHKGYFAWHCSTDGRVLDSTAASDGEEWFVTALFFASARWGEGTGIYAYRTMANEILHTMLHKEDDPGHGAVTNMFQRDRKLVVFAPLKGGNTFTDPSYQVPYYCELWGRWAANDRGFWCGAAAAGRRLLRVAADSVTGLAPDYTTFDGAPCDFGWGGHADFRFDAWRTAMHIAVDRLWFGGEEWEVARLDRLLSFFSSRERYGNQFGLNGEQLAGDHSTGLVAMNAVAALTATNAHRREFIQALWDASVPSGRYRYYDGMLYLLGMLHVSGNFRIYDPTGKTTAVCGQ